MSKEVVHTRLNCHITFNSIFSLINGNKLCVLLPPSPPFSPLKFDNSNISHKEIMKRMSLKASFEMSQERTSSPETPVCVAAAGLAMLLY